MKYLRHTLVLLLAPALAQAGIIDYAVRSVGGDRYEYEYTVSNDHLGEGIQEFTIYFALGLYDNLLVEHTPAGWDPLVIDPDPALADDGFYDAAVVDPAGAIALGGTVTGFGVSFDWLGSGVPGAQPFDVVDAVTFATLFSGVSSPLPAPVVPEPGTLWLLGGGLAALLVHRRYASTASTRSLRTRRP